MRKKLLMYQLILPTTTVRYQDIQQQGYFVILGEPVSSTRPMNESTNFMQVPITKTNIRSYHMRELAKGNFLVKSEDILLLHCIGEGLSVCVRSEHVSDILPFRGVWNCLQGQTGTM